MNKSKKIYIKALNKYNNGYIDKAIELCEESISIDIRNSASINLKGLLYYLKGDIYNAQKLWKMNYQVNRDEVAKRYLDDTKDDKERLKIYMEAAALIKELDINEGLQLLEECSESDYNSINVNNYKTICYIKKGQYAKAINSIENVMKIDKCNIIAKENKKTLIKYGVMKNKIDLKKVAYGVIGLVVVIAIGFAVPPAFKSMKSNLTKLSNKQKTTNDAKKLSSTKKSNNQPKQITKKIQEQTFSSDKMKNDVQNKNFEAIYDEYMKWKDKNLSINDKAVLQSANDILKTEGVEYFYSKGYAYINSKDFSKAKDNLTRAYTLGSEYYLYPDILYMLGSAFYLSNDFENAIKYYIEYDEKFSKGDYEETVLYDLATMYKNMDKSKASNYAQKLVDNYPNSLYNNSIIQSLLNQ